MLLVFAVYSIGVFFTSHSCNACQHSHITFTDVDCVHNHHENHQYTEYEINKKEHYHQSPCHAKINYYKIGTFYTQPNVIKNIEMSISQYFSLLLFSSEKLPIDKTIQLFTPLSSSYKPVSIIQGGDLFIIYTQQQVLYA